jgi:hypothetical protein
MTQLRRCDGVSWNKYFQHGGGISNLLTRIQVHANDSIAMMYGKNIFNMEVMTLETV